MRSRKRVSLASRVASWRRVLTRLAATTAAMVPLRTATRRGPAPGTNVSKRKVTADAAANARTTSA